jgi:putative mRNA 3-end processing factor
MPDLASPETWLRVTPKGLYCAPGDFHIDPRSPVERAVVTHGHGDHARAGHKHVLATPGTLAIMRHRYADDTATYQPLPYGEALSLGDVSLKLVPAGHILGSAQAVIEYRGQRIVVSGDYKRRHDATCAPFEPQPCDVFITEATFGLPVFRHPPDTGEIDKLLRSLTLFPERAHLVGVYALGKCQRVISLLRRQGYEAPIYMHGALFGLCAVYEKLGVPLGKLRPILDVPKAELAGKIVLAPPGAQNEVWARRLPEPLAAQASGWMRVRQRAKAGGIELPLVISDHADWDELVATIAEVAPGELWVTHGAEEALLYQAGKMSVPARALSLVGYEDEE